MKYILSLGSNLGKREENLKDAFKFISEKFNIKKFSTIYETEPVGKGFNANFLNACIEIETYISPIELLEEIEEIERNMGRDRKGEKVDRIIDIDIILNENNIFLSNRLQIPHRLLRERLFYLLPLLEIDENISEPVSGKTIKEIVSSFEDKKGVWKTGITLV